MKTLIIIIAWLLLALGAAVVLLAGRGSTFAPRLPAWDTALLHLGSTNLSRRSFAVFCLTNSTGKHLTCVPVALKEYSGGAWTRTPLTGQASRAVRDWVGVPEELKPGQAVSFLVPPPNNNGPWRLVFMCQEQAPVTDLVTNIVRHMINPNAARVQSRQFSGNRYFLSSPVIPP